MERNMEVSIKVFATATCPKCRQIEKIIESMGVPLKVVDMASAESQTELRTASTPLHKFGVHVLEAPVVKVRDEYYTTDMLFKGGLATDKIRSLIRGV